VIELDGVVAYPGAEPISAVLGRGAVVAVRGGGRARRALFDVLAGRCAPLAGTLRWSDDARIVTIAAADALPAGLGDDAALRYYAAAWGSRLLAAPKGPVAVTRGLCVGANAWLISDPIEALPGGAAEVLERVADELRTGRGIMISADPTVRADEVWTLAPPSGRKPREGDRRADTDDAPAPSPRPSGGRVGEGSASAHRTGPSWRVLIRLELERALDRPVTPVLAAIGLVIACIVWWLVPTYESFWYPRGGAGGFGIAAHAVSAITGVCAAVYVAAVPMSPPDVMAETPLGVLGYIRLQRLGACVPSLALTCGALATAAWSVRAGASSGVAAAVLCASPACSATVATAVASALEVVGVPPGAVAVVSAVAGATTGVIVGGAGLLW